MKVDYLKLSEQYASFLIAIGGVSITVLTLVLSFGLESADGRDLRTYLAAALVVAIISCFTGAHMMAETAAFISHSKGNPSGERLFLLASINIFIAVTLIIFALMLLPLASGKVNTVDIQMIKPISISVFAFVIIAVLSWMCLSVYRMPASQGWFPIITTVFVSSCWGLILFFLIPEKCLLVCSYTPIIAFTLASLLRFAWTFDNSGEVGNIDMWVFSSAITSTCASLIVVTGMQLRLTE